MSRFNVSNNQIKAMQFNNTEANKTNTKVKWAAKIFSEWANEKRNENLDFTNQYHKWHTVTIYLYLEARKKDKTFFPSKSLYEIVVCLQVHFNQINGTAFKFTKDATFLAF